MRTRPQTVTIMKTYKTYEVKYAINHKKSIKIRISIISYVYGKIRKISFENIEHFYHGSWTESRASVGANAASVARKKEGLGGSWPRDPRHTRRFSRPMASTLDFCIFQFYCICTSLYFIDFYLFYYTICIGSS